MEEGDYTMLCSVTAERSVVNIIVNAAYLLYPVPTMCH